MANFGKHDDVEYAVRVKPADGEEYTMQVFTSKNPKVAERHINRLLEDQNRDPDRPDVALVSSKLVEVKPEADATAREDVEDIAPAVKPDEVTAPVAATARTPNRAGQPATRNTGATGGTTDAAAGG